jgi:hypothetical protein
MPLTPTWHVGHGATGDGAIGTPATKPWNDAEEPSARVTVSPRTGRPVALIARLPQPSGEVVIEPTATSAWASSTQISAPPL